MARTSFKIEWDAPEHEHKERSADWFWSMTIITFAVAIASIVLGNVIFALLILLSAFSLTLFHNRPPEHMHVVVDEHGITREQTRFPYSTLHSFYIDVNHPHKKILLRSQKKLMPLIVVPLGDDVDPERLQKTLIRFLPEEYLRLPLLEILLEYLGF